jgi:hypothetical protein
MSRQISALRAFAVLLLAAVAAPGAVSAGDGLPFGHGERLLYEISWYNVVGGTASLDLEEAEYGGTSVFRVLSVAKSNNFISLFFPVEDRVESLIDRETLAAVRLDVKQRQGKRRRARVTEFDQVQHTATVVKNGERQVFSIPTDVQDSLSCLYYFRSLPNVQVGETVTIDVHESNKNWRLGIVGLNRERVKTKVGEFDTIRTRAQVEFEGVFLDRGDVYVWFTDDARRLPVRMESKIKIGRIAAKLIEYRPGAAVAAGSQAKYP